VALVSAASATPSYTNLVNVCHISDRNTYIKDETADCGSSLHRGDVGLETHTLIGCKCHVSETVVIIEAAFNGQCLHVG
jgi:hypothetical protein